jgi:hypothetical protein
VIDLGQGCNQRCRLGGGFGGGGGVTMGERGTWHGFMHRVGKGLPIAGAAERWGGGCVVVGGEAPGMGLGTGLAKVWP